MTDAMDRMTLVNRPYGPGHTPHRIPLRVASPPSPLAEMPILIASDLAGQPAPGRRWVVEGLIPDRQVTILNGDGGTGKSLLALQLGVAMATGTDWLNTMPMKGSVVYLSAEDETDEQHRRLADICLGRPFGLADLTDLVIIPLAGKDAIMAAPKRSASLLERTPLWIQIVTCIEKIKPKLLILDNLADIYAGDEVQRAQIRQFVGMLRGLAIDHDMAVLLLAHPSLSGMNSGSGSSGSTAWNNSVRSRLYLDRVKGKDEKEDNADLRVLKTMKANYSRTGGEIRMVWKEGRFRYETSIGTAAGADADAKLDERFLRCLARFNSQGRKVSPNPGPTYAPSLMVGSSEVEGASRKALGRSMNRLLDQGRLKIVEDGPPSKLRSHLVETHGHGPA